MPDKTVTYSNNRTTTLGKTGSYLFYAMDARRPLHGTASCHRLAGLRQVDLGRTDDTEGSNVWYRDTNTKRLRLAFPDPRVSQEHAVIHQDNHRWWLSDHSSKNGVRVNGQPAGYSWLEDGDLIEVGDTFLIFRSSVSYRDSLSADCVVKLHDELDGLATLRPELASTFSELGQIARSTCSVLITGATGVGKEVIARAIHVLSGRKGRFIAFNCAALDPSNARGALFGYEKGAFTGATERHRGLIEESDGGTLFMDELATLPLELQSALLRALEERAVQRMGSTEPRSTDLRLVAATNEDLQAHIANERFRNDLLSRVNGFAIRLPDLRDRREDIGLITAALLHHMNGVSPGEIRLQRAYARALFLHSWPNNIRELRHCLEQTVARSEDGEIRHRHLPETVRNASRRRQAKPSNPAEEMRRQELSRLLAEHDWNVSAVARSLGKKRQAVQRWIRNYGLKKDSHP